MGVPSTFLPVLTSCGGYTTSAVIRRTNSDQGSPFTSPQYTGLLEAAGVQISMDGKGRALENIFVERLWRTVKYEDIYLRDYATPRAVRVGLSRFFRT